MRWLNQKFPAKHQDEELNQARNDLEQAIKLNNDLIAAYLNIADVLDSHGEEQKAIKKLTHALERLRRLALLGRSGNTEDTYKVLLERGTLHLKQEKYENAIQDYQAAIKLDSNNPEAFFRYGIILLQHGKCAEATKEFQRAIALKPRHALASQALGDCYFEQSKLDKAKEQYITILQMNQEAKDPQGQALAYLRLGRLYRQLENQRSQARPALYMALRLGENLVSELAQAAPLRVVPTLYGFLPPSGGWTTTVMRPAAWALTRLLALFYVQVLYEIGLLDMDEQKFTSAIKIFENCAELFDNLGEIQAATEAQAQLSECKLRLDQDVA